MSIFDFFRGPDINQGVNMYKDTENAVLIDVREKDEYAEGHIPGSINIPLSQINLIRNRIPKKDTPLFIYCLSGGRSANATSIITGMGYNVVNNIGGISSYSGALER
ncbi:MAG: rhodanese-like domain-containing protein [Lachnospiraceae bacterium]|nr:rhodanese-like domain-containing protein [Lachnospiraceae bacterium]